MAKCRNVAFGETDGQGEMERERESGPVERRWRAGMNNVDSLFFRGIYQVGVPITRSFRSVVPPRKMRAKIAMHLCALVEGRGSEEEREEITVFLLPLPRPRSPFFSSSPISFSFTSLGCCLCALSIADFHPFPLPRVRSISILPAPRIYRWRRPYHS